MSLFDTQRAMLRKVAEALGPELRKQVVFVGGCTTGLLLTDPFTREQVRSTDDVDLIVHVMGYGEQVKFHKELCRKGFRVAMPEPTEDLPTCAFKLGELRVDVMLDEDSALGPSNRWYQHAMASAEIYPLDDALTIRVVSPVMFVATKLEAYKGRGNGDAMTSRDIEDILNLVDGRPELMDEILAADTEVQHYIAVELVQLLQDSNFEYAVKSQAGIQDREDLLFERVEQLAEDSN